MQKFYLAVQKTITYLLSESSFSNILIINLTNAFVEINNSQSWQYCYLLGIGGILVKF